MYKTNQFLQCCLSLSMGVPTHYYRGGSLSPAWVLTDPWGVAEAVLQTATCCSGHMGRGLGERCLGTLSREVVLVTE